MGGGGQTPNHPHMWPCIYHNILRDKLFNTLTAAAANYFFRALHPEGHLWYLYVFVYTPYK